MQPLTSRIVCFHFPVPRPSTASSSAFSFTPARRLLSVDCLNSSEVVTKADLLSQLKDLKAELALLRVIQVTCGTPNKLSKIKLVQLLIVRVLIVISQEADAYKNKKLLPLDLRPKKNWPIRRRLTKHQV